jgi:serine/threonine-protein kinase
MTREPRSDPPPPQSVLDVIGRKTGEAPSVSLSDPGSGVESSRVSLDPRMSVEFSTRARAAYQVLGEVARGGMGAVLRGHDSDLRRDVAIKVLDERLAERPEVVQRFVEEAQIGAQLQHPGVVPVYELGLMADERPFFTMKLIKGRTLASLLAARKSVGMDLRRFLAIFEQVCQTVAYAHSKGVLHRDLKPANVMVGAFGEVQVVDWGLAKVLGRGGIEDERRTLRDQRTIIETVRSGPGSSGSDSVVGSVLGTPAYMPPEQARGEVDALDERADVFALGALLCEVLTGSPPYVDNGRETPVVQAARAHLGPAQERLAACGADEALVRLALDCMAPAPPARPATAEEVARAVQEYLAGAEERARAAQLDAAEARVRANEERKRRRLVVALGGAVVALLLALGAGYVWAESQRDARRASLRRQFDELQASTLELQAAERYDDALAAARDAAALVEAEGLGGELADRAAELAARVERVALDARERREEAERKHALFARLDEARLQRSQVGVSRTLADVDRAFRDAFVEYGLDIEADDLVQTLVALRERGMGEELALALDEWARVKRAIHGWDSSEAEALTALAADLDDDPLRIEVRGALLNRDTGALFGLQEELDVKAAPPATTWVLAGAVNDVGGDPTRLLERAARRHPGDERFHILLGLVHRDRGRPRAARREFETAFVLRPDNVNALDQLAAVSSDLGDFPTAIRLGLELEARVPDFTPWLGKLAFSLFGAGRYAEAADAYSRLEALEGLEDEGRIEMLNCRFLGGALSATELVEALAGTENEAYRVQVLSFSLAVHSDPARRDPTSALAYAERGVELEPSWWLSWAVLALASVRADRYEVTLDALGRIEPLQEQRGDIAFSCAAAGALAHHHLGDSAAARDWLQRARLLFSIVARDGRKAWAGSPFAAYLDEAERLID